MSFVSLQGGNIATKERLHNLQPIKAIQFALHPLFSADVPAEYHSKNRNNRKIESARRTMGRGKRREPLQDGAGLRKTGTRWHSRRCLQNGGYGSTSFPIRSTLTFQKVNQSGELRCFK